MIRLWLICNIQLWSQSKRSSDRIYLQHTGHHVRDRIAEQRQLLRQQHNKHTLLLRKPVHNTNNHARFVTVCILDIMSRLLQNQQHLQPNTAGACITKACTISGAAPIMCMQPSWLTNIHMQDAIKCCR
jgi:hypothetical protein